MSEKDTDSRQEQSQNTTDELSISRRDAIQLAALSGLGLSIGSQSIGSVGAASDNNLSLNSYQNLNSNPEEVQATECDEQLTYGELNETSIEIPRPDDQNGDLYQSDCTFYDIWNKKPTDPDSFPSFYVTASSHQDVRGCDFIVDNANPDIGYVWGVDLTIGYSAAGPYLPIFDPLIGADDVKARLVDIQVTFTSEDATFVNAVGDEPAQGWEHEPEADPLKTGQEHESDVDPQNPTIPPMVLKGLGYVLKSIKAYNAIRGFFHPDGPKGGYPVIDIGPSEASAEFAPFSTPGHIENIAKTGNACDPSYIMPTDQYSEKHVRTGSTGGLYLWADLQQGGDKEYGEKVFEVELSGTVEIQDQLLGWKTARDLTHTETFTIDWVPELSDVNIDTDQPPKNPNHWSTTLGGNLNIPDVPDGFDWGISIGIKYKKPESSDWIAVEIDPSVSETQSFEEQMPSLEKGQEYDYKAYAEPEYQEQIHGQKESFTTSDTIPPIDGENPPQDLDGDGLYMDVDGDDWHSIFDVQIFFDNFEGEIIQNNVSAFDFNEDGKVDIFDVNVLFNQIPDTESGRSTQEIEDWHPQKVEDYVKTQIEEEINRIQENN